ncbi:superinfection immunity protein [Buttiauxella sp. 3AFRM03]|uniref:superinfection immunity protein n=1 Tax=Buttiauxella sp. 3AFRM03 TaxID=2479367 RepID=UPI000EF812E0|nr:superinfection immunity protein [Buttiauxella sp. 3AFRM03]AYN26712.1 superinfection immunity protein [Buttiauxella sp. 3AFRM03]
MVENLLTMGGAILFVSYFIPSVVAAVRDHKYMGAVMALNILLGWTFLGWVVALVWSMMGKNENNQMTIINNGDAIKIVKCNHCGEGVDSRVKACYFCQKEQ